MLLISFARHSSSMPMQRIAFQRRRVGAAAQFLRLSYQCPCFSMHLPSAALSCAFARPLAANPTQCRSYPSNSAACPRDSSPMPFFAPPLPVDAVLFRCNFSLCRAFPSQSTALPLLSASVPLHIGASPLQASAARSCSIARLLDAHRCNSSAIRVTAMPMPRSRCLANP